MGFTLEDQRNGGLAKGRNGAALRARSDRIWAIVKEMDADQIPETAYAAALCLMRDAVEKGPSLPMDSRLDLQRTAEAAQILFKIGRLASGEATSLAANVTVDKADLDAVAERLARLRNPDTKSD